MTANKQREDELYQSGLHTIAYIKGWIVRENGGTIKSNPFTLDDYHSNCEWERGYLACKQAQFWLAYR